MTWQTSYHPLLAIPRPSIHPSEERRKKPTAPTPHPRGPYPTTCRFLPFPSPPRRHLPPHPLPAATTDLACRRRAPTSPPLPSLPPYVVRLHLHVWPHTNSLILPKSAVVPPPKSPAAAAPDPKSPAAGGPRPSLSHPRLQIEPPCGQIRQPWGRRRVGWEGRHHRAVVGLPPSVHAGGWLGPAPAPPTCRWR